MTSDRGPRRAMIYVRISSDPTGRTAGVRRQEADCRQLATDLGWDVVAVHTDNDISAYSGKSRPAFAHLLDDIRGGRVDAVLAWHADRLYRRLPDLEQLTKVVQANHVAIRTVRAGDIDLSTASGIMNAEILAAVSKHEVAHGVERIKAAKAANVAAGTYRGGPRPFGFEADGVTVREDEARHIGPATDRIVAGDSLRSICADWEAAGIRTVPRRRRQSDGTRAEPVSGTWGASELRRLLLRARNAGLLEHRGEVVGKAVWPALVDEGTWRACKTTLEQPERRTTTGNARKWLLSGIALCGAEGCTKTVRCSTSGTGGGQVHVPAYRCWSGKHITRIAASLDAYVEAVAVERLSRPDAADLFLPSPAEGESTKELAAQANVLRAKLDQYAQDYADDLITRKQMLDGTKRVRTRLAEVEGEMGRRTTVPALARMPLGTPEVAQVWKGYSLDRKRAVIDAIMTVTILPARRGRPKGFQPGSGMGYFDPERIQIEGKRA